MMRDKVVGSQQERLLGWLRIHTKTGIDPIQAWNRLGIYRLSARIHDLRNQGHDIESFEKAVQNKFGETVRVAVYLLIKEKK